MITEQQQTRLGYAPSHTPSHTLAQPALPHSVLRTVSEDPRLRPFLSSHFDATAFVANAVQLSPPAEPKQAPQAAGATPKTAAKTDQANASSMLGFVSQMIEETNHEIQSYISQHKGELMAGMQDVAMFADQCKSLHEWIVQVQKSVQILKAEAMVPYEKLSERARELENIHSTNVLLKKVRQFLQAKATLEQQLVVTFPADQADPDPHELAAAARVLSELESLVEDTQLQRVDIVHENLPSVKASGDRIRLAAQDTLVAAFADRNQARLGAALQVFFHLKALPEVTLMVLDRAIQEIVETSVDIFDLSQIEASFESQTAAATPPPKRDRDTDAMKQQQFRDELRELCSVWTNFVSDKALQVLAVARVLIKKEDPTTHQRFNDVLSRGNHSAVFGDGVFHVFWQRLSARIADVFAEKLKTHPATATKIYPTLRRSVSGMFNRLQDSVAAEIERDIHMGLGLTIAGATGNGMSGAFGAFDQDGVFGGLSMEDNVFASFEVHAQNEGGLAKDSVPYRAGSKLEALAVQPVHQTLFVEGLSPLRDRYLSSVFQHLTSPVQLMFPQLEGYMAAVPSRHDLQAFTKAIQSELSVVFQDGDSDLLHLICNQVVKAVQLLTTKAEGLVQITPDALKQQRNLDFQRTHDQDHNIQLAALINLLEQALLTLPDMLKRKYRASTESDEDVNNKAQDVANVLQPALNSLTDLQLNQIMLPTVGSIMEVIQSVFATLHQESFAEGLTGAAPTTTRRSRAIEELIELFPTIVTQQLSVYPHSLARNAATKELACRVMTSYVSFAALLRPISESGRLRCAADISAIEELLAPYAKLSNENPVYNEFRSFRRLLFRHEGSEGTVGRNIHEETNNILSLDYLPAFRPSTLLHHLIASAPPQLANPHIKTGATVLEYVTSLTNPQEAKDNHLTASSSVPAFTVQGLFEWPRSRSHPEQANWVVLQECLDLYMQRITATNDRQTMRDWYEFVLEIGNTLFTGRSS